jgi:Domain of unknown function (DUF4338)
METLLRYRGRTVTSEDAAFIRELVAKNPGESRRRLSARLCAAWGWTQANGAPCDMVCRSLMLVLARAGHIELPPVKVRPPNNVARRTRPKRVDVDAAPLSVSLAQLGELVIRQVRRTSEEPLFNGLMQAHHYLAYTQPVGEHLKLMVFAGSRPVALFAWSSAPRHLGPRDRFIGWSITARKRNIGYVAYNSRFLILPWIKVPHLASHLLGRVARMLSTEWEKVYGHPLYLLETFVDPGRFKGTCYRAANWIPLGLTTGRGKDDRAHSGPNRSLKDVLVHPLVADFRERLSSEAR